MPFPTPIPPAPPASKAILAAFEERGIEWLPERAVRALDPERKVVQLSDGSELPYDLFLGIPVHRVPAVVEAAGMTADGWIPVDPHTLETKYPDVYAVGDVTSVGTPKAGVFAEGQAVVVSKRIADRLRGETASADYDGHAVCWIEFGNHEVGEVDVTFAAGKPPVGDFAGPSEAIAGQKADYGASRITRWFGP